MKNENPSKREAKRDLILREAAVVFARFGYDKTTLDDIGKECGLNKASLYYYFKSKEAIFLEVVLGVARRFVHALREEVAQIEDVEEKVIHYILARVRRYQEALNLNQLSGEHLRQLEKKYLEQYQENKIQELNYLRDLLQQAHDKGRLFVPDPQATAESIFLISDALKHGNRTQDMVYFDGQYDFQQVEDKLRHILQLIFRGLQVPQ